MIRIRDAKGNLLELDDLKYVEIVNDDGELAMMLHEVQSLGTQAVEVVTKGMSAEADLYARMFGLKWAGQVTGNWVEPEPIQKS